MYLCLFVHTCKIYDILINGPYYYANRPEKWALVEVGDSSYTKLWYQSPFHGFQQGFAAIGSEKLVGF